MGGDGVAISTAEAASALRWWMESGVDSLVQEEPRNWLHAGAKSALAEVPPPPRQLPEDLTAFREWLAGAEGPLAAAAAKAVLPVGAEAAEIMLLAEMPTREDAAAGQPIGGEAWQLTQRMLAAITIPADRAYFANLSCFQAVGLRPSREQVEQCAEAARRHVALAKPKRLLLLGDAPARALLGKPLVEARGHIHLVEGVRTVATFHPRLLLSHPSQKAQAWADLLLLMEDKK